MLEKVSSLQLPVGINIVRLNIRRHVMLWLIGSLMVKVDLVLSMKI